jgi:hypothetical protein
MRTLDRRTSPRVIPGRPVRAKVRSSIPARVLDVSLTGMQIELETPLRPQVTCDVRVMLEEGEVTLRGSVTRCRAAGFALDEQDRRILLYRAGIEFNDVSETCLERLRSQLLAPVAEAAAVPGAGGEVSPEAGPAAAPAGPGEAGAKASTAAPTQGAPAGEVSELPRQRVPRDGPVKIRIGSANVRRILEGKKD